MAKQWAPKGGLTLSTVLSMALISILHKPQGPRDPGWTVAQLMPGTLPKGAR